MKSGILGGLLLFVFVLVAYLVLFPNLLQASDPEFLVTKINITGNTVISSKDLAPIVKNYQGRVLTLSELQKVAALITEEYKKRGYILAKAYVPEQKLANCEAEIGILEGKIGEIIIQGDHKYYSAGFIKKHFDPLLKEQALNQDTMERAILILNEYPRLKVKTMLQAGKAPGSTDIAVEVENTLPVYLTLDYNNFGSKYIGRNRYGATLEVGNFIREGAILSLRGLTGDDPDDLWYGRASYTLPLNAIGTRAGIYYASGDLEVGREFAILDMKGKTESYGFYITHPFIKKRNMSLTAELDFDVKNAKQYIFDDLISSNDKICSVRGGVSFERTDTTGRTATALFITQGLGNILGAMENNYEYSSRYGADNRFTKVNLDLIRLQRVLPYMFLILKGSGQWASDSLVAGEQFSIGGADSIRGYPESEYLGDSGYSATAEMRISPLSNKELMQLAFFIDTGGIVVKNPVPGQEKHHALTGGGAGLRFKLPYDFDIRADVGFPLSPTESSEKKDAILYLQAVKRF